MAGIVKPPGYRNEWEATEQPIQERGFYQTPDFSWMGRLIDVPEAPVSGYEPTGPLDENGNVPVRPTHAPQLSLARGVNAIGHGVGMAGTMAAGLPNMLAPVGTYADGTKHWAMPSILKDIWDGYKTGAFASGHDVMRDPEAYIPAAVATGGGAMIGGGVASAVPGAVPKGALTANALARKEVPGVAKALKRAEGVPIDDKLVVQHNLSSDNLRFADREFGGNLPVPSIGIAKAKAPLDGFGDVSLIGDPGMVKPSAKNPVFGADAYSPRTPDMTLDLPTRETERIARARIERDLGGPLDNSDWYGLQESLRGNEMYRDQLIAKLWLRQNGLDPEQINKYDLTRKAGELEGYGAFADSYLDDLVRKRIFKGFTNSGNRSYTPFTLDNVIKRMKGGAADGEGFNYGMGNLRARVAPKFGSLGDIQDARHRIMPTDEWNAQSEALTGEVGKLAESLPASYRDSNTFTDYDRKWNAVADAIAKPYGWKNELQYQFDVGNIGPDIEATLRDLRSRIGNIGTDYFEAKPQRAVGLGEFSGAVVPKNATQDTLDILRKHGIERIEPYDKSNPAGRSDAVKKFSDTLFANAPSGSSVPLAIEVARDLATKRAPKGAFTHDQRPFYGKGLGPKGQIEDPQGKVGAFGLQSGLAGAPADGFFNPATSALLQGGVAPKQTVSYYKKQMGSRGGKLPPGVLDQILAGKGPGEVIERDWLVREIDSRAPQLKLTHAMTDDPPGRLTKEFDRGEISFEPQYKDYSTKGNFQNYTETAVGYPEPAGTRLTGAWDQMERAVASRPPSTVNQFTDSHFDHPNLEGWYRTQDSQYRTINGQPIEGSNATRVLDEVQPQRYQKMRDKGEKGGPRIIQAQSDLSAAQRELEIVKNSIERIETDKLLKELEDGNPWSIQQIINDTSHPDSARFKSMQDEIIPLKEKAKELANNVRHLRGVIDADKGVAKSPYTHNVNDATDILLKHAMRDAANDGMDNIAWTHGEAQAERYNQLLRDVKGIKYDPVNETMYVQRADGTGGHDRRRVKPDRLEEMVGKEVAAQLMATPYKKVNVGVSEINAHHLDFPQGMTLGGEGMKGFYGSGPTGDGGILTSRIKALIKKLTGKEPSVNPRPMNNLAKELERGNINASTNPKIMQTARDGLYPSVELSKEARDTIKRIGLSLYANGPTGAPIPAILEAFKGQEDKSGAFSE